MSSSSNSKLGLLLVAASSFVGGFALGLLLAPKSGKENREWLAHQAEGAAGWVDKKSHEAREKTGEQLAKIKESVRQGVKNSVPDLYEATENIHLDEDDLAAG